jgi:hypothetical protein
MLKESLKPRQALISARSAQHKLASLVIRTRHPVGAARHRVQGRLGEELGGRYSKTLHSQPSACVLLAWLPHELATVGNGRLEQFPES